MGAYWKAILAALAAGIASLITAVSDNPTTDVNESVLTMAEILTAIGAVVVAFGATSLVKNAGFVNLAKVNNSRSLAVEAYERRTESDWAMAPVTQREEWANATDAVLSSLRREK